MKVVIMPGFSELIIIVNPTGEVSRGKMLNLIMPWLYAPWPDAQRKGIAEIAVKGETLRDLLSELSEQYKQANVDFEPIDARTNHLDFDYDVLVNGKRYEAIPHQLDAKLGGGDEVKVKMLWRWDG